MGLEIYYGRRDYPIKCQLLQPVYENNGKNISWIPSEKFIWAKEIEAFGFEETNVNGRRVKSRKGAIETISLASEEIGVDWKVIYDGVEFIIERLTQQDDNIQQIGLQKGLKITTRLYLRG